MPADPTPPPPKPVAETIQTTGWDKGDRPALPVNLGDLHQSHGITFLFTVHRAWNIFSFPTSLSPSAVLALERAT